MAKYKGNPVSKGIAIGKIFKYRPYKVTIDDQEIQKQDIEKEIDRYAEIKKRAHSELDRMIGALREGDKDKADIMRAHAEILDDPALEEMISAEIKDNKHNLKKAIDSSFNTFIDMLEQVDDDLIRERVADMKDVRLRLLRNCDGAQDVSLSYLTEPVVVLAHDLYPSDTASLDRNHVLGIITEVGGATSHTAIIARSYGIPALLGVVDAMELIKDGETVVVDALNGELCTEISSDEMETYKAVKMKYERAMLEIQKYKEITPITQDGIRIETNLNIGNPTEEELRASDYTDGIGLFRSEFLFMGRDNLPSEEEQLRVYKKVLSAYGDKTVILRTLDIGGDKKTDCLSLPIEDNPFLGNRALRYCFSYPEIFRTQLRAALRAGVCGNLWLMFPMVESIDDIRRAKRMLSEEADKLEAEGIEHKQPKIGIMIEIPSIAIIADKVAKEVDFASIGTNDLTQYTLAVDRMNPNLREYYQKYNPAILRLIRYIVESFDKYEKPICVCGELGGDELAAAVLIGFGMRRLSMSAAALPQTKKMISKITMTHAKKIADVACDLDTAQEVEDYLREELKEIL